MVKQQFPYTFRNQAFVPYLPITLLKDNRKATVQGLVDSGSTINVLPYHLGLDLGGVWDDSLAKLELAGNLSSLVACPFFAEAIIGNFNPVRLAFGWVKADIPLILGQVNLFVEFDICFYRKRKTFELTQY